MKENNSATSSIFISIGAVILGLLMFTQCGYGGTSSSSYTSSQPESRSCKVCYREFTDSSNKKCIRETNMCKNCYYNYCCAIGETPTKY